MTLSRALGRSPAFWILGAFALGSLLAPLLSPYEPEGVNAPARLLSPSPSHWLGTDGYGMDVATRVLYGARKDLSVALVSAALALLAGALLGSASAYLGGRIDDLLQRLTEVLQAFPVVLFAMAALMALGDRLWNLILVLVAVNVPVYVKIARSVVLPLREAPFVEAARSAGRGRFGVLLRHLLPVTVGPAMAQFSVNCAWSLQIVAGLSFLGLGVDVPEPEWGLMVQQGASYLPTGQWWVSFFPGVAIVIAVYAFQRLAVLLRELSKAI
jgi:peptide/nickel transport system permease protein